MQEWRNIIAVVVDVDLDLDFIDHRSSIIDNIGRRVAASGRRRKTFFAP
jgi:hypothetical protein